MFLYLYPFTYSFFLQEYSFFFLFNPFKVFVLPLLDGFLFYPFYFLISSLLFCLFYPVQRLPWELHWALSLLSFLTMAAMAAMIMELSWSSLSLLFSLTSLSFLSFTFIFLSPLFLSQHQRGELCGRGFIRVLRFRQNRS